MGPEQPTTWAAGQSNPVGSRNRMEMLRRGASRAIIRPSWPPPTQPTLRELGIVGREEEEGMVGVDDVT